MFFCPIPEVSHVKTFDLKACRSKLADYYKRTATVPTSVWSSICQVKLEKIYTRLSWVKKEQTPTGTSPAELTDYSELFTADENGVLPKRILVQGETGIGKSTFVKTLALHWAKLVDDKDVVNEVMASSSKCGGVKEPSREDHMGVSQAESSETRKHDDSSESHIDALKKFQLVIAVPLKYVSKCQTFREVLSCSRLIPKDEEYLTDGIFTYICNNQEKVLLVFDGYDEYRTGSVAETQFGPRSTSPICEIFHRNELRDCTFLVTTRSSRAGELLEFCPDKHAEITGFGGKDQLDFMERVLDSRSQAEQLLGFLLKKEVLGLARVPLLNLFFCLLFRQEKEKLIKVDKRKTPLYRAIIRCIFHHSKKRLSPAEVKGEDYQEILPEIGKVALESLLKGSQAFECHQLSENVRGEKSVMVGLLQLAEKGASPEPTEIVSFIHKSIQEYLAAWFIANICVPEGNLGGIEKHAATLTDCEAIANVLQFVCGLSTEGAVKVLTHLSTVRANDPSVDFSKLMPVDERETDLPWAGFTLRHSQFNNLVRDCFREVSLAPDLIEHVFGCTGGIIVQERPVDRGLLLKPEVLTQQATHSWAFYFINRLSKRWPYLLPSIESTANSVENLYQSVQFLDLLHIPLRMVRNSKELKLGDFLTKFRLCSCTRCTFASVLCCTDGKMMVYITDLTLMCDIHTSMFTEAAAVVCDQSVSTKMCSSQPCLKFLTSLRCIFHGNRESLKELVVMVRNCKHLQGIKYGGDGDYVVDFLEELAFPGKLFLTITCIVREKESIWNVRKDFPCVPYTAPRREESLCLIVELLCLYSSETAVAIVSSISPESLRQVSLKNINLTTSAAATLGKSLSKMIYLRRLQLIGPGDCDSHGRFLNLNTLFEGLNHVRHLEELYLANFSVVDSFAPLTEKFRFFADLKVLVLLDVNLDGDGLCLLLEGSRFIPNLRRLNLSFNPLGRAVRAIASYLDKLPELRTLEIYKSGDGSEDLNYVWKAAKELRPKILVLWRIIPVD